jgi:hypothetical protein
MKKILVYWIIGIVLLGSFGVVRAEQPFVRVSATPDKFDLGTVLFVDEALPEVFKVKVESNCLHGPVVASVTPFKNSYGGTILPEHISIQTSTTGNFVPMIKPVVISEPAIGSHDVMVKFKIQLDFNDRAGKYSGNIVFTVMPPPY